MATELEDAVAALEEPATRSDALRRIEAMARSGELAGRCLAEADLEGVDLSGADLRRVDFSAAYLGAARLTGAELDGAALQGIDLSKVSGLSRRPT